MARIRITLDTNVLISALLKPGGAADKVLNMARLGKVDLILSPFILEELTRVLIQKFHLPSSPVRMAVRRIEEFSHVIHPQVRIEHIREKLDDNRILECAASGKVDFLITGDKKHILPLKSIEGIPIITVRAFLDRV